MNTKPLGRLERVDLRDIWITEASDFTPWLAQKDNLDILGDTLGIDLELEAQERSVGPFRADILCKDINTDDWVLIENQLERTDHNHLGQLLTYASGLEAVTIVWIAASFADEHRSTLDWLNRITDEEFSFFGLEVELWRIRDSLAAPKFNIVSQPNDWFVSINPPPEVSETGIMQRKYWEALQIVLNQTRGPVAGNKKPQPNPWMAYPIGRSSFHLNAVMTRTKQQIRVELYIVGEDARAFLALLHQEKDAIEGELGYALEWDELPGRDQRIACYLNDVDPEDESDWPRQHEWLATHLNELHSVFAPRVAALNADEWKPES